MEKKIDWTKPVEVISHPDLPVRVICTNRTGQGEEWPVVILLGKAELRMTCRIDGRVAGTQWLRNKAIRTSTWQNVYKEDYSVMASHAKTQAAADKLAPPNYERLGYLVRDYEDGEFVGARFVPKEKQ